MLNCYNWCWLITNDLDCFVLSSLIKPLHAWFRNSSCPPWRSTSATTLPAPHLLLWSRFLHWLSCPSLPTNCHLLPPWPSCLPYRSSSGPLRGLLRHSPSPPRRPLLWSASRCPSPCSASSSLWPSSSSSSLRGAPPSGTHLQLEFAIPLRNTSRLGGSSQCQFYIGGVCWADLVVVGDVSCDSLDAWAILFAKACDRFAQHCVVTEFLLHCGLLGCNFTNHRKFWALSSASWFCVFALSVESRECVIWGTRALL